MAHSIAVLDVLKFNTLRYIFTGDTSENVPIKVAVKRSKSLSAKGNGSDEQDDDKNMAEEKVDSQKDTAYRKTSDGGSGNIFCVVYNMTTCIA